MTVAVLGQSALYSAVAWTASGTTSRPTRRKPQPRKQPVGGRRQQVQVSDPAPPRLVAQTRPQRMSKTPAANSGATASDRSSPKLPSTSIPIAPASRPPTRHTRKCSR